MDYTISKLAKLAGISTRTLRYYDEIGLLRPKDVNMSGYRVYGQNEVDALQQILFYRELSVSLDEIKSIVSSPDFTRRKALEAHLDALLEKQKQLATLIDNVRKTIAFEKGEIAMTDKEKFEGFKKGLIEENEKQYGAEVRAKYGEETVNKSNERLMGMSRDEYERMEKLAKEVNDTLKAALETKDPAGELAQKACALHKQWLMCTWPSYSPEAHKGLGQMYVDDERFKAYYEKIGPGCAAFLRDALMVYCG